MVDEAVVHAIKDTDTANAYTLLYDCVNTWMSAPPSDVTTSSLTALFELLTAMVESRDQDLIEHIIEYNFVEMVTRAQYSKPQIINQHGATSGFKMCFFYRIPAPLMPGGPKQNTSRIQY